MEFYQVKREADNKKLDKQWNIFVGGELFTEKEMEKYCKRWANRNRVNRGAKIEYTSSLKKKFLENFIEREIPKNVNGIGLFERKPFGNRAEMFIALLPGTEFSLLLPVHQWRR